MSLNIFTELEITQDLKITQDLEILQNIDICGNILMSGEESTLNLKTIKSNRSTNIDPCGNYVDISGSALLVPRGSTASRMSTAIDGSATAKAGMIMYDTSQNQFIGVIDTAKPNSDGPDLVWTGLGGVISTDQKTRIEATNDGTNNSGLKFFTNTLGNNYNMCINENGNVGIGNAMFSANEFLSNASHLNLFTNTNASFLISHADIGDLDDQDFGGGLKLTFETGGNAKIYNTYSAGDLIFGSGGYNDRMRILANGNVGIGTDSPVSALHVKSTTQFQGIFLDDESGLIAKIARGDSFGDPYIKLYSNISDNGVDIQSNRSSYFNGGNVGIGTTSPEVKLDVLNSGTGVIAAFASDTAGDSGILVKSAVNSDSDGYIEIRGGNSGNFHGKHIFIGCSAHDSNHYNSDIVFKTRHNADTFAYSGTYGATERMRIQYDGNVGIGTTTPSKTLNVYTSTNFDGILLSDPGGDCIKLAKGDSNTDGYIKIYGNGTNGIELQPNANSWFSKNVGIGTTSPACSLDIRAPDNGTAKIMLCGTDQGTGDLFVGQSPNYGGGIMYNGDGSPSTGTTTDAISFYRITEGGDPIEVFFYMYNSNTVNFKGDITSTGDITAYYSDERLKTFKGTISDPIEKIKKLNGYYFVENELAKSLGYNNDKLQVGVSAQEVEKVLPEIVTDAPIDKKYKTIWYEKLTPLLIEGIKAQQTQIQSLQAQIDELKELIQNKL